MQYKQCTEEHTTDKSTDGSVVTRRCYESEAQSRQTHNQTQTQKWDGGNGEEAAGSNGQMGMEIWKGGDGNAKVKRGWKWKSGNMAGMERWRCDGNGKVEV